MVELVRRNDTRVYQQDNSELVRAYENAAKTVQDVVGKIGTGIQSAQEAKDAEYKKQVQENIKQEQTKLANQQKTFDASDKLIASDRAGQLKNDLLRWNLEQRSTNPNYIGTKEHEARMREYYNKLYSQYGQGLGEAGRQEFTTRTQSSVNEMLGNDIKWAYEKKIRDGEKAAKTTAETMNNTAGLYGANGDVIGFKDSHKENRQKLKDYIDEVAPAGADKALEELDRKSLLSFFNSLAKTNPEKAKMLLANSDSFQQVIPDDMLKDQINRNVAEKNKTLQNELVDLNAQIFGENNRKERKKLEKKKKELETKIKNLGSDEDITESAEQIRQDVFNSVGKEIEYNNNLLKQMEEKQAKENKISDSLSFLDNPIIYRAKLGEEEKSVQDFAPETPIDKEIKEKAEKIYNLSDKVGNGEITPDVLKGIVDKVASITVSDKGIDSNVLKAFDGDIVLREAGASPEQLQTYHQMVQRAMTDTEFKQNVAALANKPDFDTMFLDRPSRDTGLLSWFRTVKDDDTQFVENLGRQAYVGAMNLMIQGKPDEALAYYDNKVEQAYDFIKRDVIDVDYVKRQLEKTGSAMVELNGNMTKIVGRLPNGEYIVESTGEKVNG